MQFLEDNGFPENTFISSKLGTEIDIDFAINNNAMEEDIFYDFPEEYEGILANEIVELEPFVPKVENNFSLPLLLGGIALVAIGIWGK